MIKLNANVGICEQNIIKLELANLTSFIEKLQAEKVDDRMNHEEED